MILFCNLFEEIRDVIEIVGSRFCACLVSDFTIADNF